MATTINIAIANVADDGQAGSGAGYNNNFSNVTLGGYFGTANGYFRFLNVTIPKNSTITAADMTAGRRDTQTGQADIIFYANKVADAANPTSDSDYNAKAVTTASVTHSNQTGNTGTYTSPSLVSVIQEIVDQATWASGNALMILVKDNGSNAAHGGSENRITFKSRDGGVTPYATLNVTYDDPPAGGTSKNLLTLGVG